MKNTITEQYDNIKQTSGFHSEDVERQLAEYITFLQDIPFGQNYNYRSPDFIRFYEKLPAQTLADFHKLVLLKLIMDFDKSKLSIQLPASIDILYEEEFLRISHLIETPGDFVFEWSNDRFVKDVSICCGRMYPVGPGLLEVSGVPRALLYKKGPIQFCSFLLMILFGMKGVRPVLENHTHLANVKKFNPDGWLGAYHIVSDILRMNRDIKGFMRSSWFIDPTITDISPRLAYLREIPVTNGAKIFYMSDEGEKSGSFSRSLTRKKLFDDGEYIPKTYYLLWPRDKLIKFVTEK